MMKNPLMFSGPVFRANLYYDVCFIETITDPLDHLRKFIEKSLGSDNDLMPKVSSFK